MASKNFDVLDYSFNNILNGIAINPQKASEIVIGHGEELCLLSHNFSAKKLILKRSIQLGTSAVVTGYTSGGDKIAAVTGSGEVRLFDAELNLNRRYVFGDDDQASALGRPIQKHSVERLGVDLLIGFDSGKVFAYDSRSSVKAPAIKIENHSNTINDIQCLNWWNFVSVGDDAYVTMHDFRSKKCRQEYGPMEGLPRNICICPISKKTVICSLHCIYVFETHKYDEGPILRADPPYKGRMPVSAVSLSTKNEPGIFAISYLDSPYVTILNTTKNKWTNRYPTPFPNVDHFTHVDNNPKYMYFIGEETHFCIRSFDHLRTNYDMTLNVKAGKRSSGKEKTEKTPLNFSGLVSDDEKDDNYDADSDFNMEEDNESLKKVSAEEKDSWDESDESQDLSRKRTKKSAFSKNVDVDMSDE